MVEMDKLMVVAVSALRAAQPRALKQDYKKLKKLLNDYESITEIVWSDPRQCDDWIQIELLPLEEFKKNGLSIVYAVLHARDGNNDVCCDLFFREDGCSWVNEDIYSCNVRGLPEKLQA